MQKTKRTEVPKQPSSDRSDVPASAVASVTPQSLLEEMQRLVYDSTLDPIVVVSLDGRIRLWNHQAEVLFGWTEAEALDELISERVLSDEEKSTFSDGLRRYYTDGDETILDRRVQAVGCSKSGRAFPIEIALVAQTSLGGRVLVAFIQDKSVEEKVSDRLRQLQKVESLGLLAGGIAHDFNNILASISGNVALAKADVSADHLIQESLTEIQKAAARAAYIVRQILTFSGSKDKKTKIIDVKETISDAIKLLRATLPAKMVISASYEPNVPTILADATEIHQIILNLGINADQAMANHEGTFEIQVSKIDLDEATAQSLGVVPGQFVKISAGDSGSGMTPEVMSQIFEPFFTTNASGEGTGLGLSVVFGIVSREHGAISVSSDIGKGSVFHIYLPASDLVPTVKPAVAEQAITGNHERILYVDDDEALVYMMTRTLKRLNYDVVGFQHSMEAFEAFVADPHQFALIITDISMPHMDGATLVRKIRAIRPEVPIVMVTGYIRPKDLEEASSLGINELILKPNTVEEMGEVLHRILTGALVANRTSLH